MSNANIAAKEAEIVESFGLFDDPMDRYDYLIDLGKEMAKMSRAHRIDTNLVKGCQSKVWLHAEEKEGKIYFEADSNTVITKGIIALLVQVLSGETAATIATAELGFIEKIDLRAHLSSSVQMA